MTERVPAEQGQQVEGWVEVYCRAAHRTKPYRRRLRVVWVELEDGTRITPVRVIDPDPVMLDGSTVVGKDEIEATAAAIRAGAVEDLSTLPVLRPVSELSCRSCGVKVEAAKPETLSKALAKVLHNARRRGDPARVSLRDLAAMVSGSTN